MESADNGIYRSIRPKDGEQGITFIYDIRTEHLSDAEAQTKIAEIKSLSLPVWWPLDSKRIGSLLHGKDYEPQPPTGDDEVYMALLPENQPESIQSKASVKQVKTADDFKIWADMANRVFAGGYQDIHPVNHYRWCQNGRLIPYIAYTDGQPAAVAAIMDNSGVASLEFVATLEEYRRMGLARTVCVTALRSAFASGGKNYHRACVLPGKSAISIAWIQSIQSVSVK